VLGRIEMGGVMMRLGLTPFGRAAAGGLAACLLLLGGASGNAQGYPDRPVRVIVPYTPGGGTDVVARAISQRLSEKWHQAVFVDNRPGAGTAIGGEAVAKATPDGYTLLFSDSTTFVILPHVYSNLKFDPAKDFAPIALAVRLAPVLAVANNAPAKTVPDLIAYAKAHPGELTYASPGVGTYTYMALEYFKHMAGIDILHVPYKGSSPAMTDLLAGRVSAYFVTYSVFESYEKAGKLKVIAAGTKERIPARPDLPTMGETVPGYFIDVWFGLAAPAGTPSPILDKINADVNAILRDPNFVEQFIKPQAYIAGDLTRAQFGEQMRGDLKKWGDIVRLTGIKLE
jgi:tripartite-type tricarboxylate transporter receptor subunit TctC